MSNPTTFIKLSLAIFLGYKIKRWIFLFQYCERKLYCFKSITRNANAHQINFMQKCIWLFLRGRKFPLLSFKLITITDCLVKGKASYQSISSDEHRYQYGFSNNNLIKRHKAFATFSSVFRCNIMLVLNINFLTNLNT